MHTINYSIIIPHYNIPELLVRLVKSIPDRDDVQIIVVDDNSPGADTYTQRFPELSRKSLELYLTHEGRGAGFARNVGLDHALGKWLIFADSDDFFEADFNDILDEYIDAEEDVLYFNHRSVYSDDITRESNKDKHDILFEWYAKNHDDTYFRSKHFPPWSKIVRHSLIKDNKIRFDETRWSNDAMFSAKAGCMARQIKVVNKSIYVLTEREGSLISGACKTKKELLVRLDVMKRVSQFESQYRFNHDKPIVTPFMFWLLKMDKKEFVRQLFDLHNYNISATKLLWQWGLRIWHNKVLTKFGFAPKFYY